MRGLLALFVTLVVLVSCRSTEHPPPPVPACAADALDRMDGRTALPLLPMMATHQKQNMRDHLVAVQEIIAAATIADFAAVEKAAARIGFSEQMGAMCTHMGAGAPGFSEQAIAFHTTADSIGAAAKSKDRDAVLLALANTLHACTTCHATWKQRVIDQ
jgi:cytochrome c556